MIIACACGIITVISTIVLIIKLKNDKLDHFNTKIVECEKKLQISLEEKFSIISELQPKLSSITDNAEFNLLCDLEEIIDDDFMINAILNKADKEIKKFLEERRSYIPNDDVKELLSKLHETSIECTALKQYYNEYANSLNNLIANFPNNIIAKFKKIKHRELYNDPVEEEFEILKKK